MKIQIQNTKIHKYKIPPSLPLLLLLLFLFTVHLASSVLSSIEEFCQTKYGVFLYEQISEYIYIKKQYE